MLVYQRLISRFPMVASSFWTLTLNAWWRCCGRSRWSQPGVLTALKSLEVQFQLGSVVNNRSFLPIIYGLCMESILSLYSKYSWYYHFDIRHFGCLPSGNLTFVNWTITMFNWGNHLLPSMFHSYVIDYQRLHIMAMDYTYLDGPQD